MKLRNKKTGEIGRLITHDWLEDSLILSDDDGVQLAKYASFAKLNEEWEDYEETKEYWFINSVGGVIRPSDTTDWTQQDAIYHKEIGNYFETKEEAERAVERLRAWKRLKDKGFRFTLTPVVGSLDISPGKFQIEINAEMPEKWFCCDAVQKDLDDCFGGEE